MIDRNCNCEIVKAIVMVDIFWTNSNFLVRSVVTVEWVGQSEREQGPLAEHCMCIIVHNTNGSHAVNRLATLRVVVAHRCGHST